MMATPALLERVNMSQVLTLAQIEQQFPSEWVLVGDPQTSENLEIERGAVLGHSKDRDEVYRQAVALRPTRFAVLYTGRMPENTEIVLSSMSRA
jgi:hypothetical protein